MQISYQSVDPFINQTDMENGNRCVITIKTNVAGYVSSVSAPRALENEPYFFSFYKTIPHTSIPLVSFYINLTGTRNTRPAWVGQ